MNMTLELILNSGLLWIILHAIWIIVKNVLYDFTIPCIIWGSLLIVIVLKKARISPPDSKVVKEILGKNLLTLNKEIESTEHQEMGEQYHMRVVAHRGGGYDYPENSILAFRNAKEKGCTAIELDVLLTKDNIPITFHDPKLERTTGLAGYIKDMTWDQLKDIDITYNHALRDKFMGGEKIPLFYDALEECLRNNQRIIIDIKESRMEIVPAIIRAYELYPKLFQRAIVSSFNPLVVYMIRRKEPRIVASLAWRPRYFSREWYTGIDTTGPARYSNPLKHITACCMEKLYEWALPRYIYYIVGISIILLQKDLVHPQIIKQWYDRDIRVMAWAVNLPSEKLHFSKILRLTYLTDTLLADNHL